MARPLEGKSVTHISSTAQGGGVAELLYTLVPLMQDAGLNVTWNVISADDAFFTVTKNLHNGLQGMEFLWTDKMARIYETTNKNNAEDMSIDSDFIIIHDPQPAALLKYYLDRGQKKTGKWIWRCHIDLTEGIQNIIDYIGQYTKYFDACIFTLKEYEKPALNCKRSFVVHPTIDPLSPKNMDLQESTINEVLNRYGLDPSKPIVTQVARFDPWKDPLGVIDAYRAVKKELPDLQLAMVAGMATDDPEGWHYHEKTVRYAGLDTDIHFLSSVIGVGNIEVNAIQRASDVIILKSKREGFGLVVSEGAWKGKPTVGNKVGGIVLQIEDNKTGFLVDTTEKAAEKILFLLENKERAKEMGNKGKDLVKHNFLSPQNLRNYLNIFHELRQ